MARNLHERLPMAVETAIEEFAWGPAVAVGNALIDTQHRELFDRANLLLAALRRAGSDEDGGEVGRTLGFLSAYVGYHFADEEALMAQVGYPAERQHRAEHQAYVRRLALLASQHEAEAGSAAVVMSAAGFLRTWLLEHIGRADRDLAAFAAAREGCAPRGAGARPSPG